MGYSLSRSTIDYGPGYPMKRKNARNNFWVHANPSRIHGQGLFARKEIQSGTPFVVYDGPRLSAAEGKRLASEGNAYIFQANRREFIDGSVASNLARYANHSCEPNAESVGIDGVIWLRARRTIAAGEEITYDYGYSFRDEPVTCRCGAPTCCGRIVRASKR